MVTIINYTRRRKEDGTTFFVLEVHGGIEFIQSKTTGNIMSLLKDVLFQLLLKKKFVKVLKVQ
jgi:hypothetical protein